MTTVSTDLRNTRESAKRLRFEPTGRFTATNVQDAITQAALISLQNNPTAVTFAMSPYTPVASDTLLLVDTAGGPVTIAMRPAAERNGVDLEIKDDTGHAAANPVSVVRNGAETIDGLTTYPIDGNYGSAKFGPQLGGYFVHA